MSSNKNLTQQIFHPGLFNRPRSSSLSEISNDKQKTYSCNPVNESKPANTNEIPATATACLPSTSKEITSTPCNPSVPWQRVPTQKHKRNRSPDETETNKNSAKRIQSREQELSKRRGINTHNIEEAAVPDLNTSNSFSLLNVDEPTQPTPVSNGTRKPSKPPPIMLYGIDNLGKLTEFLEEVVKKTDYTYKVVNKNQLIISTSSVEIYKQLIEHIRAKGLIGHTFTQKDEKCMRIVIKHLHFSTPKDAIVQAIEETGNKVKGEIVTARSNATKEPLNTFFVNIFPHENNRKVKEIKYIYHQKITIEDPKRKNTVVQCTRCQQYGHTKNNCMRPYRCVKCAGEHKTTTCTIDRNTPAVCTLCSGSHPANYKGCQVYKEIAARKWGNKQKQPQTKVASDKQDSKLKPDNVEPKAHQNNDGDLKLYSEAVKRPENLEDHTQKRHYNSDLKQSQRTISNNKEKENSPIEQNYSFIDLIIKQTERIDQLISQMSTMMNLIMTLISKQQP